MRRTMLWAHSFNCLLFFLFFCFFGQWSRGGRRFSQQYSSCLPKSEVLIFSGTHCLVLLPSNFLFVPPCLPGLKEVLSFLFYSIWCSSHRNATHWTWGLLQSGSHHWLRMTRETSSQISWLDDVMCDSCCREEGWLVHPFCMCQGVLVPEKTTHEGVQLTPPFSNRPIRQATWTNGRTNSAEKKKTDSNKATAPNVVRLGFFLLLLALAKGDLCCHSAVFVCPSSCLSVVISWFLDSLRLSLSLFKTHTHRCTPTQIHTSLSCGWGHIQSQNLDLMAPNKLFFESAHFDLKETQCIQCCADLGAVSACDRHSLHRVHQGARFAEACGTVMARKQDVPISIGNWDEA